MSTKWEIYFGVELPWEEIWGRHFKNLANRKSKQLQWKVIHSIIYTEERLQKMNKSSIKVITKLPNSEQSYKGKVKTHNYINRQNQSTTRKL